MAEKRAKVKVWEQFFAALMVVDLILW